MHDSRAGATFFDWTKDGVDEDEETPVQLQTDPDTFAAEMEAKGVGTDRPVVVCPPLDMPSCSGFSFFSPTGKYQAIEAFGFAAQNDKWYSTKQC